MSKPAIGITVGVVAFAIVLSILIGLIMKNSAKSRITKLDVGKADSARKKPGPEETEEANPFVDDGTKKSDGSTIGEAIKKEQEMLKGRNKGGYIGGVGVARKKKKEEDLLNEMIAPEEEQNSLSLGSLQKNRNIAQDIPEESGNLEKNKTDAKKRAWEYLYAQKAGGGFIARVQGTAGERGNSVPAGPKDSSARIPKVEFFKPYRAVIDKTFTSADTKTTFVATGTQNPLKGWKIIGKATPNFSDYRFHVEISGMLGPDNVNYPTKGYAASIDESDGIISSVKHDDIAGTITSGLMAGASSFFNALRKDTTTIEVGSGGTVVTGQTKNEDRLREGGLAAGDTIFQGMSRKIENSAKKVPTLIMEKGIPVLVYFTP